VVTEILVVFYFCGALCRGTRSTLQSFRDAAGISVAMAQAKLRKVPPKINSQIGSGDQNFVSNPTQEQVC